ncbi:MAG TPA: FAD-dependent oxidoreductase [Chthonomonadaceae bacterium]|nr:FAD-dependent oxidoreductase [Chthonomonadaceae bacterium]
MAEFKHLFTPIQIGNLTLKNRIYTTGHVPAFAENGYPKERYQRYVAEKAKGGGGLVMFGGSTSVSENSPATEWSMIANRDDSIIPYYRQMAEAVHPHGAKIISQLTHMGRRGQSDSEKWLPLVAPSPIREPYHHEVPHEIEEEQIRQIVQDFGQAVRRCKEGGLDGVELSAAHNHLLDQFWSPRLNLRTDSWGGSLENRMRFSLEVLSEIRRVVGRDYVVGIRISGDEYLEGGLGLEEMKEIAQRLAATGLLDFISIIGGSGENALNLAATVPNMMFPSQPFVYLAAAIKEVVDLPILHAQKIVDPVAAEQVLAEGWADLIGMTRAQIADPQMANKAREGRLEDIRQCVGANQCIDRLYFGKAIVCIQNPVIGREKELAEWTPATVKKRVVVIGGGPGGLEAARMAALRGHSVTLLEKSGQLGGQVRLAALAPHRESLAGITRWLELQARKHGVEIRLNTEATAEGVLGLQPEVVVVATGGVPLRPDLPGFDGPNVVTSWDILTGAAEAGENVLIVDDDGAETAPSVADYLTERGKRVEIVTTLTRVGQKLGDTTYPIVYQRLYGAGVTLTPNVRALAYENGTVTLQNVYALTEETREGVDTVVLALGNRSVDGLYRALKGRVPELTLIGDAMAPRGVHNAILEGTYAGRKM